MAYNLRNLVLAVFTLNVAKTLKNISFVFVLLHVVRTSQNPHSADFILPSTLGDSCFCEFYITIDIA